MLLSVVKEPPEDKSKVDPDSRALAMRCLGRGPDSLRLSSSRRYGALLLSLLSSQCSTSSFPPLDHASFLPPSTTKYLPVFLAAWPKTSHPASPS